MDKRTAIDLLGGTLRSAADHIGITPQAVHQWPDPLTNAIRDRVEAALARMRERGGGNRPPDDKSSDDSTS